MSKFLNCSPKDLLPLQNVTSGLNCVIKSLNLYENEEIMCLSLTYGSTKKMLNDKCIENNLKLNIVQIPLKSITKEKIINNIKNQINDKTRIIFLDEITSASAILLPIKEISQICRENNIMVVIDAAHSLFTLNININENYKEYCDIWLTNCHKWFCNSKGFKLYY
jgi:isopenicillin-N epimerase